MYHICIEQTKQYKKRIRYNPVTETFDETDYDSLLYHRKFPYPYGWIVESGTPPYKHWDVILMSDKEYQLGDIIPIQIIGVFYRNDLDHKFIATLITSSIKEYSDLSETLKEDLNRLYPHKQDTEGFYGKVKALEILNKENG